MKSDIDREARSGCEERREQGCRASATVLYMDLIAKISGCGERGDEGSIPKSIIYFRILILWLDLIYCFD